MGSLPLGLLLGWANGASRLETRGMGKLKCLFPWLLRCGAASGWLYSSVTQSCLTLCDPMDSAHQASLSITNSQILLKLMFIKSVMPFISSSVVPFSSCLQSFPPSGCFPMSRLFASGGQRIGASASASVLPMNAQAWFPCSPRDSQESSTAPQFKSINFFGAQLSLWSSSHIHTCLLEKP